MHIDTSGHRHALRSSLRKSARTPEHHLNICEFFLRPIQLLTSYDTPKEIIYSLSNQTTIK